MGYAWSELTESGPKREPQRSRSRYLLFAAVPLVISVVLVAAVLTYQRLHSTGISGYAGGTSVSSLQQLMGLSELPNRAAPNFTLLDQSGQTVSLSQFRGKAVALAFMDSRCTTVCPLLAEELQLAQKDLGSAANKAVFVAVNVNPLAAKVSDVVAFDTLHGLSGMANWYFLTGTPSQLFNVANRYGISVLVPKNNDPNNIEHTDYVYLIDSKGLERYLVVPVVDVTKSGTGYLPEPTLAQWGHGFATYLLKVM